MPIGWKRGVAAALLAGVMLAGCWDHDGRGRPGYPGDRPHHHHDRHDGSYDRGGD